MADVVTVERLQKTVADAAYELMKAHIGEGATRLKPLFPYCLVYMLPKESMSEGGLVIPDYTGPGEAAKVTREGIILRTWGDEKRVQVREGDREYEMLLKSDMGYGDHVLFPKWAGQPVPGTYTGDWTTGKFRFVKEYCNTGSSVWLDAGGDTIIGKIESGVNIEEVLRDALEGASYPAEELTVSDGVQKLLEKFVLFPKDQTVVLK